MQSLNSKIQNGAWQSSRTNDVISTSFDILILLSRHQEKQLSTLYVSSITIVVLMVSMFARVVMGNSMEPEKPMLTLLEEFEKVNHIYVSTGYYMYIEASIPRRWGDYAILISPTQRFSGNMCLKFSYHMYGATIGRLDVTINSRRVFSKSGNQGNKWFNASIAICVSGAYSVRKIFFVAVNTFYCNFVCFWSFANLYLLNENNLLCTYAKFFYNIGIRQSHAFILV